jgi:L-aspartate oxidase
MVRHHPLAELAPRDVVSRSIAAELRRTAEPHVFLDLTHREPAFIRNRFPRIHQTCLQYGVDISTQLAPVHPAAHYAMGGVRTDLDGRASVAGLFAAGEVACTGVHGANRLASNSLLEGVVFGARAGRAMRDGARGAAPGVAPEACFPICTEEELRGLAWEKCGLVRTGDGLRSAIDEMQSCGIRRIQDPDVRAYELRNIHAVALLMARCALAREESRGAHYRSDFPARSAEFEQHSVVRATAAVLFMLS